LSSGFNRPCKWLCPSALLRRNTPDRSEQSAMARGDGGSTEAERIVPSEMVHSRQRACMSCSLIKSTAQFVSYGCENCPFMSYQSDRERVSACTTPAFVGCYITIKPKESWVAKWQRTGLLSVALATHAGDLAPFFLLSACTFAPIATNALSSCPYVT
jgi:Spt4/RpoE2 zinc finger